MPESILWPEFAPLCIDDTGTMDSISPPASSRAMTVDTLVMCRPRHHYKNDVLGMVLKRLLAPNFSHRQRSYEDDPIADSRRTATRNT